MEINALMFLTQWEPSGDVFTMITELIPCKFNILYFDVYESFNILSSESFGWITEMRKLCIYFYHKEIWKLTFITGPMFSMLSEFLECK